MEGMGQEKLYFLLSKSVKHKKAQFRAKCLISFCRPLYTQMYKVLYIDYSYIQYIVNYTAILIIVI